MEERKGEREKREREEEEEAPVAMAASLAADNLVIDFATEDDPPLTCFNHPPPTHTGTDG